MQRADGAGHVNGMFVTEDIATSRPPTEITDGWCNSLQEEIISVISAAGIALDKTNRSQLLAALRSAGVFSTPSTYDSSSKAATTEFVRAAAGNMRGHNTFSASTTISGNYLGAVNEFSASSALTCTMGLAGSVPTGTGTIIINSGTAVVNLARSGTNVFDFGSNDVDTAAVMRPGDRWYLTSNGSGKWIVHGLGSQIRLPSLIGANGYRATTDSNSPTGYLIEQWGSVSVAVTGTQQTGTQSVTLPLAITTCLYATASTGDRMGNTTIGTSASLCSSTALTIGWYNALGSGSAEVSWFVKGY